MTQPPGLRRSSSNHKAPTVVASSGERPVLRPARSHRRAGADRQRLLILLGDHAIACARAHRHCTALPTPDNGKPSGTAPLAGWATAPLPQPTDARPRRLALVYNHQRRHSASATSPRSPPPSEPTGTLCRVQWVSDAALRRRALDRGLCPWARSRRVAATGDAGHPRPRPCRCAGRHDPAVPQFLGDLRLGSHGATDGDCRHAAAGQADGRADGEDAGMRRTPPMEGS